MASTDCSRASGRNLLQRTAGPYIRVKLRSPSAQSGGPLCPQERTCSGEPVRSERCQSVKCMADFGKAGSCLRDLPAKSKNSSTGVPAHAFRPSLKRPPVPTGRRSCKVDGRSALYVLRGGGILKSTTVVPWPPARIDFILVGGG
jgi:hypothetical protein